MIPTYHVDDLTGGLGIMFQNVMKIGFTITIIIVTLDLIFSLLIWLFRNQEEIRKSDKIWNKKFYRFFDFNNYCISSASYC